MFFFFFFFFFFLRQLLLPRLPIFWLPRKIFYCQLWDVNLLMSTYDILKNERII